MAATVYRIVRRLWRCGCHQGGATTIEWIGIMAAMAALFAGGALAMRASGAEVGAVIANTLRDLVNGLVGAATPGADPSAAGAIDAALPGAARQGGALPGIATTALGVPALAERFPGVALGVGAVGAVAGGIARLVAAQRGAGTPLTMQAAAMQMPGLEAVGDFLRGFADTYLTNLTMGLRPDSSSEEESAATTAGRATADAVSFLQGLGEIIAGGSILAGGAVVCGGGTAVSGGVAAVPACAVSVPALAGGIGLIGHGAGMALSAAGGFGRRAGRQSRSGKSGASGGKSSGTRQPRRSPHAQERRQQGRAVGTARADAARAARGEGGSVFKQKDGRYVVRGKGGREHIFERDGTHVTTIDDRSQRAHRDLVRRGERQPLTPEEFEEFKEIPW